jgi:hypothetical protein
MNPECKRTWDREYLIQQFGYTWLSTHYKKHRENLLFDLERAKFPDALRYIENHRKLYNLQDEETYVKQKIMEFSTEFMKQYPDYSCKSVFYFVASYEEHVLRKIREVGTVHYTSNNQNELDFQIEALLQLRINKRKLFDFRNMELYKVINNLKMNYENIKTRVSIERQRLYNNPESQKAEEEKIKYFGHCPVDGCKGLINQSWKCGLCETIVCRSCKIKLADKTISEDTDALKKIRADHVCDPNDLASIESIRKEAKPCPRCKIPIYRISGCAQMWCTECHVVFDYKTGDIITNGPMHNPHYLDFKRQARQNNTIQPEPLEVCDTLNGLSFLWDIRPRLLPVCKRKQVQVIEGMHTSYYDIRENILRGLRRELGGDHNLKNRCDYLRDIITEDQFKKRIQRKEKELAKIRDFISIYEMFVTTFEEYMLQLLLQSNITTKKIQNFMRIVFQLINYTNESFGKLLGTYKNCIPQISMTTKLYHSSEQSVSFDIENVSSKLKANKPLKYDGYDTESDSEPEGSIGATTGNNH